MTKETGVCKQQPPPVVKVFAFFLLQKHQQEVLAMVDQKRKSRWRSSEEENKKEVLQAMRWSLSEGWSLLLHLLGKRREVLQLAADFYHWLVEVQRLVKICISSIL